jgi:PAS domain-containing protein
MTIRSANAIPENERFAPFFKGDGEMPELIRKYDWTGSPLGPLSQWPNGLNTILGLMLHTKFPMFLFWGPELICFYNDPFRPSLGIDGKHPAIGKKGKEVWAEIWEFIGPLIDQVMTRGIPVFFEDQLVPFYRNGKIEDIYWTFSYSPAYGENGQINGVVVICTETTPQVNLLKDIRDGKEQLDFAIDAAELGTWDLDPATNRFVGNDRLKEWFGLEPQDEIKLSRALDNIVERDRERVLKTITESLAPGSEGRYDIEYSLLAPGTKEERKVIARGKAFFDEKGVAYRFSGTLQDVTAERRTRELADANYRLQQSNIELNQFAYVASHDLQ